MRRLLLLLVLIGTAASAQYVPPVLKGVQGDARARRANGPVPFPDAGETWQRVTSKHFVFISAAGERRTRDMAEEMETLAAALGKLNARFDSSGGGPPTRVYVFSRKQEVQPYFDMLTERPEAHVNGLFVSQKNYASILMLAGRGGDRTPLHELVHLLIERNARPPLWLEEGLADVFSNAQLRQGSMYIGGPLRMHVDVLKRRDLPLEQLFRVERESNTYNLPEGQGVFYAKSWAVVDWLIHNGGRESAVFYDFFHDVESGVPVAAALQNRYGKSVKEVERLVGAYGGPLARPPLGFYIPVPETDKTASVETLDRATSLYELGRFWAGFEEMAPQAERHFRGALQANPRHARSLAALAVLKANAKIYDDAGKLFEQALAADPKDASIHLDYAEALMQNEIGPVAESEEVVEDDAPRFRKARALAQRALDLGGDQGRALGDLGTSYIVEKTADLAPGIAALEKAHAMLPGRMDYALHLFAMVRRSGQKGDELFAKLDAARSPQVKFAARAIVVRIDLARTNELLHEGKYDEAAAILRTLAANSPDESARADFERQAAEVARVAESNRQIAAYNAAIEQINKGKYAAARKTLTELLATATDPRVISDARKLQGQLKGRKDLK
jgi:tetratricopeptide (TPR) repeat protein